MHHIHTFTEATDEEQASQNLLIIPDVHVMGRRIVAALLDYLSLGVLTLVVNSTFGITQNPSALPTLAGIPSTSNTVVALPWLYLVLIVYYSTQEALFSTTIGKFLMGLKVVQDDGSPITFMGALIRNSVRPIDAILNYLPGWGLALCSSHRRRLGDHLARTLVVSAASVPTPSRHRFHFWLRFSILMIVCASFVAFCMGFDYYGRPPLVIQSVANGASSASVVTDHGTITDLTLSQPIWQANTITYVITFQTVNHGIRSNCWGHITLKWDGFIPGWEIAGGDTTCTPIASRAFATPYSNVIHST